MPKRLVTLLVFLGHLVVLTNVVLSWDSPSAKPAALSASKKSCCTEKAVLATMACCEKNNGCAAEHPGQKCPDTDGSGGCHCPGCSTVCFSPTVFTNTENPMPQLAPFDAQLLHPGFYFAQHLPEEISSPIWQPPKTAA